MRGHARRCATWLARLIRGLWPDRNPLRRRSDRIEAAIVAALLAAFLGGAPVSALTAESSAYAASVSAGRAHAMVRHHVPALVLGSALSIAPTTDGTDVESAPARVCWRAADGTVRTGVTAVAIGTRAGATVRVWTDASGNLAGPPPTSAAATASLATAFALAGLTVLLICVGTIAHCLLERRRLAAWEAEWAAQAARR